MKNSHIVHYVILLTILPVFLEIAIGLTYLKQDALLAYLIYFLNAGIFSITIFVSVSRLKTSDLNALPLLLVLLYTTFTKILLFYGNLISRDIPTLLPLIDVLKEFGLNPYVHLSSYQRFYMEHPGLIIWGAFFTEIMGLNNYDLLYFTLIIFPVSVILSLLYFAKTVYERKSVYLVIVFYSIILGVIDPFSRSFIGMPLFFLILGTILRVTVFSKIFNGLSNIILLTILISSLIISYEFASFLVILYILIILISLHALKFFHLSINNKVGKQQSRVILYVMIVVLMLYFTYEIYSISKTFDLIASYLENVNTEVLVNRLTVERNIRQWIVFYTRWLFLIITGVVILFHLFSRKRCKKFIIDLSLSIYALLLFSGSLYIWFIPTKVLYYVYIFLLILLFHASASTMQTSFRFTKFLVISASLAFTISTVLSLPPNFIAPLQIHEEVYKYGDYSYFFTRSEILGSKWVYQHIEKSAIIASDLGGRLLFFSYGMDIAAPYNITQYVLENYRYADVMVFWRTPDMDLTYVHSSLNHTFIKNLNKVIDSKNVKIFMRTKS
jgi:hypothetical protein